MSEQSSSYGSVEVLLGKMFCITISSVGIFFFWVALDMGTLVSSHLIIFC